MKKLVNGELLDMTAEEISEREIEVANELAKAEEAETAKQAKIDLKLSAKTKLMNGEALTEDEANVMVGL
jgi:hypothetical protein